MSYCYIIILLYRIITYVLILLYHHIILLYYYIIIQGAARKARHRAIFFKSPWELPMNCIGLLAQLCSTGQATRYSYASSEAVGLAIKLHCPENSLHCRAACLLNCLLNCLSSWLVACLLNFRVRLPRRLSRLAWGGGVGGWGGGPPPPALGIHNALFGLWPLGSLAQSMHKSVVHAQEISCVYTRDFFVSA